jgi:hypothetical protein
MASPRRTPANPNVWHNDLMSGASTVAGPVMAGVVSVIASSPGKMSRNLLNLTELRSNMPGDESPG